MGRYYYDKRLKELSKGYNVVTMHPYDVRDIVETFEDLLSIETFDYSVYEGMRVLVLDECNIYELIAVDGEYRKADIGNAFFIESYDKKKFWKRLTIETITTKEALQRAKNNLVNGALIYISKDIDKRDVLKFDGYFGEGTEVIVKDDLNTEGLPIGCFDGLVGAGAVFCYYSPGESREYLVKAVSDGKYNTDSYIYENAEDRKRYLMVNGFLEPYEESDNSENIEQKAGLYFCEKGVLTMAGGGGEDIYTPNASDEAQVDLQGVKAENLKGKTFSEVLDVLLFPEYGSEAGALPVLAISNPNATLEVGTTIDNASYTISQNGSSYRYIKDGTAYKQGAYTHTTPVVTTQKSEKATFGTSTRSTSETSYVITGPSADKLSEGKYLYKSKGTPSSIEPLLVGSSTITLASTSSTITGVYKGGKNGSKSDGVCVKADGQLSSSVGGTYSGTLSFNLLTDTSSTTDHAFSTLGTKSVELYIPSGVTYTVKLTATKFNAGNGKFEEDSDLTKLLDALKPTTSGKTFTDASGASYEVTSYSFNPSSITTVGKFIVSMLITKK